jgi:hypothetical protein
MAADLLRQFVQNAQQRLPQPLTESAMELIRVQVAPLSVDR